ncbi:MAG: BamA/TamA family outer membrane protein [Elusimicrobia bacterium]|nr:BamA/TamA family outer membrane protein [Elusimicrobiota bacterium]
MKLRHACLALLLACAATGAAAADARPVKKRTKHPAKAAVANPNPGRGGGDADSGEVAPERHFPTTMQQAPKQDETPRIVRWMIRPLRRGMFIRLPIMDTDPNRGVTIGVMPIWVLQGQNDDRIQQIHAPSLTYNKNFQVIPTYRFYYYPQEDATFIARASYSKFEREALGEYEDGSFLGTAFDIYARLQYNVDAGQRFFGFGPDSSKHAESNYREEYTQYRLGGGVPLAHGSPWRVRYSKHYQSGRFTEGSLPNLPDFARSFPGQLSRRYQQVNENRFSLDYDTRDHGVTTGRGVLVKSFAEFAIRGFESQYDYSRYGLDARWFRPWESDKDKVFAVQAKYEQLLGPPAPFWVQSRLGGKYSLRAYGDGRYIDRGMATVNVEQRFKVYEAKTAGVTTELQLAPFIGMGEVFDNPGRAAARYARPVVGAAVRAVAKPQVVGSVDFGVGRDGLAVFMDINYSF